MVSLFGSWLSPRPALRAGMLVLVAALVATGCLPHSCNRQPERALFPADSASRAVAQALPADSLTDVWSATGPADAPFAYPRTLAYTDDGTLLVADGETNRIVALGADGAVEYVVSDPAFDIPFLSGVRGDTAVVFNAGADRFDLVTPSGRLDGRSTPLERPSPQTLVYTAASDTALYVKVLGQDIEGFIGRVAPDGGFAARAALPGPYWRDAGFLRVGADSLFSLSGFRPMVDKLPLAFADGARVDSMRLVGFDSPMLPRSRAYAAGDVEKPPLLAASAASSGDGLYVLNLRPGWVHIDRYDRSGRLVQRLVERNPANNTSFYPLDLAVYSAEDGLRLAIALRSPEPRVDVYTVNNR